MNERILVILVQFLLGSSFLAAARIQVDWPLTRVETGERAAFSILVPAKPQPSELSLGLRETNQDWELVSLDLAEGRVSGEVQCFAVGDALFPGFVIRWRENGHDRIVHTPPCWFFVSAPATDLTAQPVIRGLRGPRTESFPWLFAIGLLLLAGLLLAGVFILLRRKRGLVLPSSEEIPDPWQLAKKRLEILRSNMPHDPEKIKEHIFLLNETLKQYLSGRSGLHLVEQTSDEVVCACRQLTWTGDDLSSRLRVWLNRGDLAKFAKQIPSYAEFEAYSDQLEDWLEAAESGWQRSCREKEAEA